MTASDIISKFDSIAALARELGVPMTTVSSWGRANHIPVWRQPEVLRLAHARGIDISTGDFPPPEDRIKLGKEAA
jgi:hypothetical protein